MVLMAVDGLIIKIKNIYIYCENSIKSNQFLIKMKYIQFTVLIFILFLYKKMK
jgi:hypothetical protein